MDPLSRSSLKTLKQMISKKPNSAPLLLQQVELLLCQHEPPSEVMVFPNSRFDRKLIHLMCELVGASSFTDHEKPFHEVLYSPNCVIGCGCDTVHVQLFPMILRLQQKPKASLVELAVVKPPKLKPSKPQPSFAPPPEEQMWHRLPAPALVVVLSHLPLRFVGRVLQVCSNWRRLGDSPIMWRTLYEKLMLAKEEEEEEAVGKKKKTQKKKSAECVRKLKEGEIGIWKDLVKDIAPKSSQCGCGVIIRHSHQVADFETSRYSPEGPSVWEMFVD
jgi:hypothetical protein